MTTDELAAARAQWLAAAGELAAAETESGQVRSGGADRVAPGYTDAVAEYFRKLSKGH